MLVLGRAVGEGVMIGHDIKITVVVVSGDKVRIGIDAPPDIEVHREEVYLERQANLRSPSAASESPPERARHSADAELPGSGPKPPL